MLCFSPRDVLDEILDLIVSVSGGGGFLTYSFKSLTSCLTAAKTNVISYCENESERSGKKFLWSIKIVVK